MWCNRSDAFFGAGFGSHLFYLWWLNMEKGKTALFIGHRDCYNLSMDAVIPAIEEAINYGVVDFLNGGQGNFDNLCAKAVDDLKGKYPYIKLHLIAPYPSLKVENDKLFDGMTLFAPEWYIEKIGFKRAIPQRNEAMIDKASVAICYVNHTSKGSYKTLQKAVIKGLKIIYVE